jgi:TonB-dependent receptor
MHRFALLLAFILSPVLSPLGFAANAQTGIIRGQVIEGSTGEALIGATAIIKGTTNGSTTDFDGKFEIKVPPGTYELQISFVSFQTITISNVEVGDGKVTVLDGIRLNEEVQELESVVITAQVIRTSEAALVTVKRKSPNVIDGISAASFRKIGDSDAADAAKRVTGVSVEGGKYVYVRGLGDRYTKTTLNGVDIPGLDPDRNTLQIDIFPTNLIDNLMVLKSSVAEMPADFTGGVVNIETKDFPDERIFDVSFSLGYNPWMHFNKNHLTYNGGSKDYLGFDDGTRALPDNAKQDVIPSPISGHSEGEVNSFLKEFNPTLGARKEMSLMDYNIGISLANQFALRGSGTIGYIFSGTYKNTSRYYDDMFYGEYQNRSEASVYELRYSTIQRGAVAENNVLLSGLGGVSFKSKRTKLMLTLMHLQNGEDRAGQFSIDNDGEAVGQSGYLATSDNLEYNQRSLTNLLLNGEHRSADQSWKIDWRVSPTLSRLQDPDVRKTAFTIRPSDTLFIAGAGGNPSRIWRNLEEQNLVGKIDLTKEHSLMGRPAKLKFGVSHVYKNRDYSILSYNVQFFGLQPDFDADPNNVMSDEFLYPSGSVYMTSGNNNPNPNEYNSSVQNMGGYLSTEFSPLEKLKTVIGLRGENYVQHHTGRDQAYSNGDVNGRNLDNQKVLDSFDLFPSANVIYALDDRQNFRVSYSRTIARPSFKELSFAQILDPVSNRIFNGSLFPYSDWDGKLTETRINNLDVRWELFFDRSQLFSVSAFYKTFDRPIELVRIPEAATTTEFQPRNVGDGQLFGAELEVRKSLDFLSPALENFILSGNFTYVRSQIDMTDREYDARKVYEKEGQTIKSTRQMAGQAPFIINGGLAYENSEISLDAGVFYNVKGSTLMIVGSGLYPDVFAQPFHSLNFNINKAFGKASISFNVSNILNDVREEVYKSYQAENQVFTSYSPRTAFSIGLKYSF